MNASSQLLPRSKDLAKDLDLSVDIPAAARRVLAITATSLGLACGGALAQTSPIRGAPASAQLVPSTDVPMPDYLGLLGQIAPAAQEGAQAYLSTIQRRCGRSLSVLELRRAISDGTGDPVLMAMIAASHRRDAQALDAASRQVVCPPSPKPGAKP